MPVKLGGSSGGGAKSYTSTTGTALETLVAGDQVRLSKGGKFIKSSASAQTQDRRLAACNGATWLMTTATGADGTTSMSAGADHANYTYSHTSMQPGSCACFLSNGWGMIWLTKDSGTWQQDYFYLQTFNIATGAISTSSTYMQFRAYGYYGGNSSHNSGGFVELKNDGTYTWVSAYKGQRQNTGTLRGGYILIKVQNSSGYIVGVHGVDVANTSNGTFYERSQAKFMTDTCMANDIVAAVRNEGYYGNSGITIIFRRYVIGQADANGITSPSAGYNTWTESIASAYTPIGVNDAGLFVLHDANRTFLLYRRLNNTNSGTTNRLQYKIITFPSSGGDAYTTNVDWTTLVGSDEGGALTEQETAKASIVRLSDNNFAVFASSSTTVIEVQKFTWNGSAIAENGSKYTITNSSSNGWQYSATAGYLSGNIVNQYIMDRHGDGKIHLFSNSGVYGQTRYITRLDFANSEAKTVDFQDINGSYTYGDPHISSGIMNDQDGSLYFVNLTADSSKQGVYVSKVTTAKFDIADGITNSTVGEVSTGAALNGTATVQLFEGITSGADLSTSYYAKKENMQYLLDVDGAPPAGGGVVYPTISKVNVSRQNFHSQASGILSDRAFTTSGSLYVTNTGDNIILEVIGAGSVNGCYWFHGTNGNISHHTRVEIDGVVVYGTLEDAYNSGNKPNHNYNYAWSLTSSHYYATDHTEQTGLSHPITFKSNFKIIITGSATATWTCRASITRFVSLA